jgi:hypothetical protein
VLNNRGACTFYEPGLPSPWTFISPIYSLIGLAAVCRPSLPRHEAYAVSMLDYPGTQNGQTSHDPTISQPRAGHPGGTECRSWYKLATAKGEL